MEFSVGSVLYMLITTLLLTIVILYILLRIKSQLIFDVYPLKGVFYRLKYLIAWFILRYLRHHFYHSIMQHHFSNRIVNVEEDKQQTQDEKESFNYLAHLERPQFLNMHPEWYDVVSIMASSVNGEKCLVTMERRHRGIIKACLYIWLPKYGLLSSPKLPDMLHFTTDGNHESTEFKANGLYLRSVKPMYLWQLKYDGTLYGRDPENTYHVHLDMQFRSNDLNFFYYNRDLSVDVLADSIARESWNQSFYAMLKDIGKILEKRMHYEQSGILNGYITITNDRSMKDKDNNNFNSTAAAEKFKKTFLMQAVRDHSFGTERCLSTINRYVYIALFLDDGTHILVGNLSQPNFFLSSLKVGFVYTTNWHYVPITSCNFELYSYGERGAPSNYQNFIIETSSNNQKYFVQINAEETTERYMGRNWEAKVYNQFVSCCVNGRPGHGITEYLYRHQGGRPAQYAQNDPKWFQHLQQSANKSWGDGSNEHGNDADCDNHEFVGSF